MQTNNSKNAVITFTAMFSSMAGLLLGLIFFALFLADPVLGVSASQQRRSALVELLVGAPMLLACGGGCMIMTTYLWAKIMSRIYDRKEVESAMGRTSGKSALRDRMWKWVLDLAYGNEKK